MLTNALFSSGAVSPSGAAAVEEQREVVSTALDSLAARDREILFLRHFEGLPNKDIACLLGLTEGGASVRHLRALGRLQSALERVGATFDPTAG